MRQVVIFDTEYTSWERAQDCRWSLTGMHREVIQIAAIKLTEGQSWQQAPTFSALVKPVINPELSDFIIRLTGISRREMAEKGESAEVVFGRFAEFCGDCSVVSNGQDINVMAETAGLQRFVMPLEALRFGSLRGGLYPALRAVVGDFSEKDYPSGRVYELLGLELPTRQVHNALHDVFSLAATVECLEAKGFNLLPWDGVWPEAERTAF